MNILISKLPNSGWWASCIPKYKDNPAMIEGAVPNMQLLHEERQGLISSLTHEGHEVIELDFPEELDGKSPKHDFIFIRDPFISDQNGTVVILRAGELQRRIENKVVKYIMLPFVSKELIVRHSRYITLLMFIISNFLSKFINSASPTQT